MLPEEGVEIVLAVKPSVHDGQATKVL
jgi:hypothetical protein